MRDYLRMLRNKRGMSSDDVARVMGVTAASYSMIETGRRQQDMTLSIMHKLADTLGVTTEVILRLETEYQAAKSKTA